jgi:hypothetical protein
MSAVVRKATRLSGTFAVLTGGSNDDLQRKVSLAPRRAREIRILSGSVLIPALVAVRSSEDGNTVYLFSNYYFFRSLLIHRL